MEEEGEISLVKEESGDVILTIESFPTDKQVTDEFYSMKIPLSKTDYGDLQASFQDVCDYLMVDKIPVSDTLLYQIKIRGTEAEKAAELDAALARYESSGNRAKDDARENSDHNCGDPNCPHKSRINYQMMLADLDRRLVQDIYKLDEWTPFDYPIIDVGEHSGNIEMLYCDVEYTIGPLHDFRYCETYALEPGKDGPSEKIFRMDTYFSVLEGVYFPGSIPDELRLYANDNLRAVIKTSQERRYYCVGFVPQGRVVYYSFGFYYNAPSNDPGNKYEAKVIKHLLSRGVIDRLTERKFTSKFKPEFSEAVKYTWFNEEGMWIQPGYPKIN